MAFNRELSQFASYLDLDASANYIGITSAESTTNIGFGKANPTSKIDVVGDGNFTGVITATQFYGNLDYSYVLNATAGVRTEFSVVDNGGDGSLSYDNTTGIISYVGPSSSEARAHFSATSSDFGSLVYDNQTGVFAYTGVTTSNIHDQFSASSADIGSLSYNASTGEFSLSGVTTSAIRGQFSASSADIGTLSYNAETGEISLAGVTTAAIRNQFSGGTGVTISNGEVSIGQPVGTNDSVTFASVNSTGIVTASGFVGDLTGNADTATTLENARDFSASGDATAPSVSFDGSGNVDLVLTLADSGVVAGSYGSSSEIPTFTVDSKGRLTAAGTTSVGTDLTIAGDTGSETIQLISETLTIAGGTNLTSSAASDTVTIDLDDNISLTSVTASGIVTAAQFVTGASGEAIGINTNTISGPATLILDPAAVGDDTGKVVIKGDLQVDGTQTIINSTTVTVEDKNIQIADGAVNDAAADGAGITVNSGDGDKTFQFNNASDAFKANISLDVASGEVYKINGTEVLSSDTLGSGVVNSSLTSVGTLGQLNVTGVTTSSGGFVGDLTGDVTGNADTATALETGRDFSASGDATAPSVSFDGTGNVDLVLTLADTAVSAGSYGSSSEIPTFTVDSKGRLTAAGTVSVSTGMTVAGDSGSEVIDLLSETLTIAGGTNLTSSAASDTVTIDLDDNISLVSVTASGIITATSGFSGDLTGNVTGNVAGNVTGNLTGEVNAAAFDTNASGVIVTGVTTSTSGFSGDLTGNVTGDLTGEVNAAAFDTNASGVVISGVATATSFVGDLTGNVTGDLTGNADTATTLETSRDFSASGDATAPSVSFDGSGNVDLVLTLADTAVSAGSYGSSTEIPTFTVDSKGRLTAAGTASVGTALTVAGDSGSEVIDLLSESLTIAGGTNLTSSAASDTVTINLDSDISLDSVTATGIITATSGFDGNLTGDVTGNLTGEVNAAAFDTNASGVVISGVATATSFVGDLTGDVTGNADTATALENARDFSASGDATAPSVSFDGTGNVDLVLTLADTAVSAGSYGSSTEIPTFTVDSKGRLTAAGTASVGTALTVAGDSGSEVIDLLSETLTIAGGTNLTSSASADTVTIDLDNDINVSTVNASGIITAAQFVTGASGQAIGISSDLISGPATITIDPAAVGDDTGLVVIKGDLQVDGTQTIINSTTVTVNDLNVMLADGAANDAAADGGGITVQSGEGNKTFQFESTGDNFGSSENMNLASGKVYKINNTEVLSSNTLGSAVVNSSLTSVGTLGQLNVTGVTTSSGGFVGDLTGNADTATALETSRDFSASGDATAPSVSFDGSGNVDLVLTLADTGVAAGSYGSSTEIPTFTVDSKGRLTVAGTASVGTALTVAGDSGSEVIDLLSESLTIAGDTHVTTSASADTVTISVDATSANTNSTIVARDGSGGFVAGIVTATSFVGDLTGNVTGDLTGDVTGNVTGDLAGNVYASSGISTFTNIDINGTLTDVNDGVGTSGQILVSVGTGVSWKNLIDELPQARTTDTQTATAGQTAFSFNYNVGYLDVFVNGVKLSSNDYTATNGTGITLSEAAFSGDVVEFYSYSTVGTGSGSVNSLNDLSDVILAGSSSGQILSYNGSSWVNTSNISGITSVTATSFYGDGSNLTGIDATALKDAGGNVKVQANESGVVLTGILTTSGAADIGGNLTVTGDLTVNGTTTTINSTTLTVDDLNIVVASGAANAAAADGAGLTVDGANATFTYASTGDKFVSNKDVEAPNFNSTSDRNLKDNIRVVDGASELVGKLEGVHFTWKSTGQETIGVIAQQIEEHLPQLVQTGDTHKTVNYNGLIGVLIEAVKEQGSQIAALKAEIEELKK